MATNRLKNWKAEAVDGASAQHLAVFDSLLGFFSKLKLLLETDKADVDSKGESGRTTLSWSAIRAHWALVTLLQSHLETSQFSMTVERTVKNENSVYF
ncbi:hypothetical protein V2W45_1349758, partial [Cenococcum geophilum]